ncbi:MAG: hypothetical protein J6R77_01265 [Clostridia bacterium]|nr:hypothetical protein [Clostridia bacterium]
MKKRILSLVLALCLLMALVPAAGLTASADVVCYKFDVMGDNHNAPAFDLLAKLNAHRTGKGLDAAKMDVTLVDCARQLAAEKAVYFGTTRPDNTEWTTVLPAKFTEYGAACYAFAATDTNADAVLTEIKNNSSFLGILQDPACRSMGITCMRNNNTYYWVVIFCGTPMQKEFTQKTGITTTRHTVVTEYTRTNFALSYAKNTIAVGERMEIFCVNKNMRLNGVETIIIPKEMWVENANLLYFPFEGDRFVVTGKAPGTTTFEMHFENAVAGQDGWKLSSTLTVTDAPRGMLGDVDGDNTITSTDARLVLQYYAGKISSMSLNLVVADADGDGKITSTDARLILQYYAGKIQKLPAA